MSILIRNAQLVELDPPSVGIGDVRIEGDTITRVASEIAPEPQDEIVDAGGAVVMPGLVNAHSHLYSALAVGMPGRAEPPRSFTEILEGVWWRLDRALDAESIEASAVVGSLAAVRCGTTTVIDHHASPNAIAGSLDRLVRGIERVGLRGVLCYEVTDRNGEDGALAGIEENRRFAAACKARRDGRFAAMMGAHASFTLSDKTLERIAGTTRLRLHIHLGEDPCDEALSRSRYGASPVERLDTFGLLNAESILAHAVHVSIFDLATIQQASATIVHNPRSNMNNHVGHACIHRFGVPVALGTDGIGSDMFAEARAAWLKARDVGVDVAPRQILSMLGSSQRTAGRLLGIRLGEFRAGAAADLVITDYWPPTPLDADNLAGHVLFGLSARHVRHVMVAGRWSLFDRRVASLDEGVCRAESRKIAQGLWERMSKLP